MRTFFRVAASVAAVSSVVLGLTVAASAQNFPSRPVTLVVPFPPGGVIDTTARVIEGELSKELGQPIVIENKGGSGGNLGTQMVARAQPDGHTILMVPNATVVINPHTFKNYPIDPVKDLAGVAMVGETYLGLVVKANSPFNTVQDIVAAAKAKPGEFTFAHVAPAPRTTSRALCSTRRPISTSRRCRSRERDPRCKALLGGHITMSYCTIRRYYAVYRIETNETDRAGRAGAHQGDAETPDDERDRAGRRGHVLGRYFRARRERRSRSSIA